jgi:Gluconate 2-dehydrogenase subunit 3
VPVWLTDAEYRTLEAACARLIPPGKDPEGDGTSGIGATEAGVAGYVDQLLGAFSFDPPRIWAGGPTSGRRGGDAGFARFHPLTALDELAWRTRIEGSRGLPEREFNGPVVGLQQRYREGLAALGEDFCDQPPVEQDRRLREHEAFTELLYGHACEGMYGAPEYGGNRDGAGWRAIGFAGDVQPRGWTDAEVSSPSGSGR